MERNRIRNLLSSRLFLSISFSLCLILLETGLFGTRLIEWTSGLRLSGSHFAVVGLFILLLGHIWLVVFSYFAFRSGLLLKGLFLLVFSAAVFVDFGYMNSLGRFTVPGDISRAFTSTSSQKFAAVGAHYDPLALLPCLVFAAFLVLSLRDRQRHKLSRSRRVLIACLSVPYVLIFLSASNAQSPLSSMPTNSLFAFSKSGISYAMSVVLSPRRNRERVAEIGAGERRPPWNNIVLIVDESVRGDHLSLNGYHRDTTPLLKKLESEGALRNWGVAVSGATCSMDSHDLILTGIRMKDLGDGNADIATAPLLFQYAKAAGYKTHYLDGQMDWVWGSVEGDGINYVDERVDRETFERRAVVGWDRDFEIARSIDQIISGSSGNFIFVFKRGIHFPYRHTFPEDAAVWKPSFDGVLAEAAPDHLQELVNAYDNGIRYNLDRFFSEISDDLSSLPNNTVIIYTSDHGQSLGEDAARFPHCGESRYQAIVPLFVIGDVGDEADTDFKASHENIFPAILDLMEYPVELRKQKYAISLLKAKSSDSTPRFYAKPSFASGPGEITRFD